MNTSDEEPVHKSETVKRVRNGDTGKGKTMTLNIQVKKLRKQLKSTFYKMEELQKENHAEREKLQQFEKATSAEAVVLKEKLESLQELLEDRNRQVKEL